MQEQRVPIARGEPAQGSAGPGRQAFGIQPVVGATDLVGLHPCQIGGDEPPPGAGLDPRVLRDQPGGDPEQPRQRVRRTVERLSPLEGDEERLGHHVVRRRDPQPARGVPVNRTRVPVEDLRERPGMLPGPPHDLVVCAHNGYCPIPRIEFTVITVLTESAYESPSGARRHEPAEGGVSPRRPRPRIGGRALMVGNADEVLDALRAGAKRDGVTLVDPDGTELAEVAIAAVRTKSRSTLALGIRTLDELADRLEPDAARLVIAVRAKMTITPDRLMGPLSREILFQVAVAAGGLEGARKLRRARARLGSAILDAAGLHVFRIGRMRQDSPQG